ncbi:hypothetical protein Pint_27004 [Pistacia integerrima]|uniref:Uncharacterized protein n=1 Tax=Pistacia integerrima TaxID=434235 RepID=A0ACC0YQ46_9ROSI|nr:hypothetical protein Pint_27004 [Pistacia integerrima]
MATEMLRGQATGYEVKNGSDNSNSPPAQPDCRKSFCDWCCYWCCCGCCCDEESSSKIEGQAGNGKHTEMNGGQPADGSATTPNNRSSSGQASGQQSAIDNATTATNKSNPGQVSDQRSANDIATTEKSKSSSGQASGQQSAKDNTSAKKQSNFGQASGQQSADDSAANAKNKSRSSGQASVQLNQKQENNSESPGVGEKSKKDKLLGTSGSSDQDLGKKTSGTEQPVHNSLPKGDVRQEDIKKNGKDLNPQKGNNSNSEHSLEEQPKGPPRKIEKQKDFGKQPGFKNKDNTNIDTSLPKIVSSARNPSSEQQKDVLKQAKNIENQINTGTSSPIIANSSSLGQGGQILSQEQRRSVTKPEGIKKDVKNKCQVT